jgi:hypothetical protein
VGSRKNIVTIFWPQDGITVVKNDNTCAISIKKIIYCPESKVDFETPFRFEL